MPEMSLKDTITISLSAQEPWPDNVKLFQPYEVEQILLPDNASCLAVQAFLKMCNLPFEVEMRWNAEFMSPSGRVPFIKCGAFVVSELEPIVQFAANKGVSLCSRLSTEEKAEMRAYMSLITNVLVNAELYVSWLDEETFNTVTKVRNSSVYPWPLGWLQTRSKRGAVAKRLKALHWHEKTMDQVLADVEQCCNSLSQRLGDKEFFFGTLTPLDALLYGHVRSLLASKGPKAPLLIKPITTVLLRHTIAIANLTEMKFSPQEDYLISQAQNLYIRKRLSPDRLCQRRVGKSKQYLEAGDDIYNIKDNNYGYKPFASKEVVMAMSKEGNVTCMCNNIDNVKDFIKEITKEIVEKADEVIEHVIDKLNDDTMMRNDFEVIVNPNGDFEFTNLDKEVSEFLDTIDEVDLTDTTVSIDTSANEDVIQIISDTDDDRVSDSDGLVNNKHLLDCNKLAVILSDNEVPKTLIVHDKGMTDDDRVSDSDGLVNNKHLLDCNKLAVILSDNEVPKTLIVHDRGSRTNFDEAQGDIICDSAQCKDNNDLSPKSSGSKSTLKCLSGNEITVENLIKSLREKNSEFEVNYIQADVE